MESVKQNNNNNINNNNNMFYGEGKSNEKSLVWHQLTVERDH